MKKVKIKKGKPQKSIKNKLKILRIKNAKRKRKIEVSRHRDALELLDEQIKAWSKAMQENTPSRIPEDYIIPERRPREEPSKMPCFKKKNLNKLLNLTSG